ncbi:MAG: rhamnan synthesis F family protein, partial [Propionibacteriaceae bacterium]|nr:rhamnan synthesis F family protein [Propionibacteriaceae bacterium]
MRRAAIYFFYDADGIADDYIDYFLTDFCQNVERLVVVCNGSLRPESRALFEKHTAEILVRPNQGFDVWAYKAGLDHIGWEALRQYDEVVLLNFTIMGPIRPFREMFDVMAARDVDFWGITKFTRVLAPAGTAQLGKYLPEHIQSHFTVYRKHLLDSPDLERYWASPPPIHNYKESIGRHEALFTQHFADAGFAWDVYINPPSDDWVSPNLIIVAPVMLLERYRCPIIKRRSFFQPKESLLNDCAGEPAGDLMRYLESNTTYDTGLIWRNILRTCLAGDIVDALGLCHILPDRVAQPPAGPSTTASRVVLVMHLFFPELLDESLELASHLPPEADIIVTTGDPDHARRIEAAFAALPNQVRVIRVENRGRDVSGLLIGAAPHLADYDLACFFHDKKSTQNKPPSLGLSFARRNSDNVLGTPELVQNIIGLFASQPLLGILMPPEPNHGPYYQTLGSGWTINFANTQKLAHRLGLRVPLDERRDPVAPLGSVFWFRPAALRKLFAAGWRYTDFPPEDGRVGIDGGIMHAIERVHALVVQDAGFYPAYVMATGYAGLEVTNLQHYVRSLNQTVFHHDIT